MRSSCSVQPPFGQSGSSQRYRRLCQWRLTVWSPNLRSRRTTSRHPLNRAGTPQVERLLATRYGDYLVVRYWLKVEQTFQGKRAELLAPRLTVFRKSGDNWLVVAHANFAAVR